MTDITTYIACKGNGVVIMDLKNWNEGIYRIIKYRQSL